LPAPNAKPTIQLLQINIELEYEQVEQFEIAELQVGHVLFEAK
jgi:hypothetical protein